MLVVFWPIFVAVTKITFRYDFVAPLKYISSQFFSKYGKSYIINIIKFFKTKRPLTEKNELC